MLAGVFPKFLPAEVRTCGVSACRDLGQCKCMVCFATDDAKVVARAMVVLPGQGSSGIERYCSGLLTSVQQGLTHSARF